MYHTKLVIAALLATCAKTADSPLPPSFTYKFSADSDIKEVTLKVDMPKDSWMKFEIPSADPEDSIKIKSDALGALTVEGNWVVTGKTLQRNMTPGADP